MVLYLSGPISSREETYREAFGKVEEHLNELGHIVLNPAKLPSGLSYQEYMLIDKAMLNVADGIVMLRGWEESYGAKEELKLALTEGKRVYCEGGSVIPWALDIDGHKQSDRIEVVQSAWQSSLNGR